MAIIRNHSFVCGILVGGMALLFMAGSAVADGKNAIDMTESMSCMNTCVDVDCLDMCVDDADKQLYLEAGEVAQEPTFLECLEYAVGDVATCASLFLPEDPKEQDIEAFWTCVGGAAGVYVRCNGWVTKADKGDKMMEDQTYVATEVAEALASDLGTIVDTAYQVSKDPEFSAHLQDMTQLEQASTVDFTTCANNYKADRKTCRDNFASGDGHDDPDAYQLCLDLAAETFRACVSHIYAAPAE